MSDLLYVPGYLIGGAAVLALTETAVGVSNLTQSQLIGLFIHSYQSLTDTIGRWFEPALNPLIAVIGGWLKLDLDLNPHWRSLFILGATIGLAFARAYNEEDDLREWVVTAVVTVPAAFVGAILSGLIPLGAAWWLAGLQAVLPLAALYLFGAMADLVDRVSLADVGDDLAMGALFCGVAFLAGAGLTFIDWAQAGAGVLGLMCAIVLLAVAQLLFARHTKEVFHTRVGLALLGAFLAAGVILLLDRGLLMTGMA